MFWRQNSPFGTNKSKNINNPPSPKGARYAHRPQTQVWVQRDHVRALRELGLLSGDPDHWHAAEPDPNEVARAVQLYLNTAEPLAWIGLALDYGPTRTP